MVHQFAEVAIEVGHHFLEEDDGLCSLDVVFAGYDFLFDQFDDVMAGFGHLLRDVCFVAFERREDGIVLFGFGLHCLDDFEFCPPRGNHAFVCGGAEAAFGRD